MEPAAIVPPELLVPPEAHARGFSHDDAALVLDGWLRRLASQESRCRMILGRLAAAFLRRRSQHELGFSRLDDYARERLGMSGRELQSLATAVRRLADLPAIRATRDPRCLHTRRPQLGAGPAPRRRSPRTRCAGSNARAGGPSAPSRR